MRFAYDVETIRAAERALMATVPPGTLMQRAATGLAVHCVRVLRSHGTSNGDTVDRSRAGGRGGGGARADGRIYGRRVVVLAGSGDNGGDALFAAALLARRGAQVDAVRLAATSHDAGTRALLAAGGRLATGPGPESADRLLRRADLVLDGVVGIGGKPGLRPDAERLADLLAGPCRAAGVTTVAVDLPSGIDPDTGEAPLPHVRADLTVTFGALKPGLLVDPAAEAAGRVEVVDIGLGPYLTGRPVEALTDADATALLPQPHGDTNKYRRGVVGVVAGSGGYPGAAVLAAGSAVHAGAGMVRFTGDPDTTAAVVGRWPEVVATEGQVQAWVVGPGLGTGPPSPEVARAIDGPEPVLVDADGLRHVPARFTSPALLTPHAGELARMLGVDRDDVEARRLHHATAAARRWNAVVLLKGRTTVIAAPDGRVRANTTGTPYLATAGSGDVLSGLGGTLLAAGLDPFDAGSAAAYVHGLAGLGAGQRLGFPSASDVLHGLSDVLLRLRG